MTATTKSLCKSDTGLKVVTTNQLNQQRKRTKEDPSLCFSMLPKRVCRLSEVKGGCSMKVLPSRALLFLGLLLSLKSCLADRMLKSPALECSQVHPSCTSCAVRRQTVDGLSMSTLICRSCQSPKYVLYSNSSLSTCGKESSK